MPRTITLAVIFVVAISALRVHAQTSGVPTANTVPNPSGFMKDYSRLKPIPDKEGRYTWLAPDAELKTYTRFILPPIEIKLLIEAVVTGVGERKFVEGQPITWPDVEPVLASWAQDFKTRLNAMQGR